MSAVANKRKLPQLKHDVAQCSLGDPASAGIIVLIYRIYKVIRPV